MLGSSSTLRSNGGRPGGSLSMADTSGDTSRGSQGIHLPSTTTLPPWNAVFWRRCVLARSGWSLTYNHQPGRGPSLPVPAGPGDDSPRAVRLHPIRRPSASDMDGRGPPRPNRSLDGEAVRTTGRAVHAEHRPVDVSGGSH
ncbi:hypothetical protein V8F44DRAFT_79051 [Aspergillus fumigatus]